MRRRSLSLILVAVGLAGVSVPAAARADASWLKRVEFLGAPRAITLNTSASRDAAGLQLLYAPHPVLMGGGDLRLVLLDTTAGGFRLAFGGFLEVEGEGETTGYVPIPTGGIDFWRGHYALTLSYTPPSGAARLCARCSWEVSVAAHHESDHYTGSELGSGRDVRGIPQVGDALATDFAVRYTRGRLELGARVQEQWFIPGRSVYVHRPNLDLTLRYRRWSKLHLFASAYAEYLFGDTGVPDAYLVRNMTGVALPSPAGDILVFATAAVGHRKGLAVFTEERSLGFGVRVTFL